jgi:tetratricopeptide (TPR) repeat protein
VRLYTSSAYANSNIISGSYYGLSSTYASYLCGWSGTDPNYTPAQNNKVFGAKYGISADNQSSTLMGQSGRGGNNWIENNIVADLGSWSGSVLYGLGNWYGSDLTATTEKTADATLTWSALSANPWGPQAKVVSAGLYASSLEISSSAHSSSVQISQGKNSDDKLFEEAVADHACKLYGKAQAKYKQLLSSKRYSHSVLVLLGHLCRESADNSILSYFEDLKTNAVSNKTDKSNIPLIANLLANMHGMQGNYTKAIELYDEVMKKYPNTLEERKARVQKIYYLMEGMKDKTGAKQQLAELLSRYTDGGDDIEMIKDLVNFPVLAALDVSRSSLGKSMKESVQEEKEVAEYSLSANYPNPFNPSTTISYQLPAAGHVILKVYDVLGREVLTLVDEIKDAGSHTATFDGSKFSSGIYFTRFAVQPLDGSKPFVQTQKMLLSK